MKSLISMRMIKGLWIFYKKLLFPSLALSILLSLMEMPLVKIHAGIGISFILLTPFFHFFLYETRNSDEYYFYYNLGLSKPVLWANTLITSLLIGLLLIL